MTRKRWLRWVVIACLVPILLLLVVLLSAPLWLNQDLVKREVTKLISNATGGKAQFERIELNLFPFPGISVSQLRFSLPGTLELETQSAAVDIRFLPLLFGNVYPHRVQILAPQVRVQLEEPKPSPQPQPPPQPKPFSLKDTEASVRAVLDQIEKTAPGLAAEIKGGRVELRIGQRPPLLVEQLDVRFDVTAGTVSGKVSCASNLLERLTAEVRIASKDLDGDGHVEVSGLQTAHLGPVLGIQDGWPVQEATVNAKLKWRTHGLSDAQAQASIDAPKVALQFGKAHLELVGPVIEAAAQTKGASAELILRRVAFDSPRIAASAKLAISETGGYALEAESSDVDLPTLQATADALVPAVDFLQDFPVRFARGTVTTVKFGTQAEALADLFDLKALRINGVVENVDLSLPVLYNLKVYEASAVGSLEQGVVRAQHVQGRLEKSTGREGSFEMDLNPDVPPLRADISVAVDLPEALAVAKRVLPDKQTQQELNRVKQLEGSAVAHVTLGGDVNNVVPRVEVSPIKASARHAMVPFPIRIAGGALTYTNEALSVRAMDGAIGQSTFGGVNARLGLSRPNMLTAQQGSAVLALEELFGWAAAQPQFAKQLDGVKTVSGGLAVSVAQLDLSLSSPDQLRFQVSATPKNISIDAPRYGPPIQLDRGIIEVSEQSVSASDVKASALDAALTLSGRTDNYRQGIDNVQASATGTVGLNAQKWVYKRARIPRDFRLRGALAVSGASANWRKDAGIAARGTVSVAGGPVIGFAVRAAPKRIEVQNLTVRDDASDATLGGSLEGTHFQARFKGRLASTSVERMFIDQPYSLGQWQGDFSVEGDSKNPGKTTGSGFLQAANIRLPPELPVPLTIEKLSLQAQKAVLLVKSATVSSGESRVDITGSIAYFDDKFAIDADVRGDKVVVPVASPQPETKAAPVPDTESDETTASAQLAHALVQLRNIPGSGQVRVDIGHLRVGRLEISPLVASGALQGTTLDLRLQRAALCAITLSGQLTAQPDGAQLQAKLSARGAQLDQSIACLTDQRLQMSGKVDMDAEFSAQGKPGTLLEQMHGTFTATARDGHINKFDELAQVLKVVNLTQVIAGQMPDLSKGGMDYKSAEVQGRIEGRQIFFQKFALDAAALTVAAHGKVDYATEAMDVNVLVAPFKTVTWVISYIPILRSILGGMLIAVPVHVGGTLSKPVVVPLGPSAVGSRLLEIMGNTLKLPGEAINLVAPPASGTQQPAAPAPSGRQ